MRQFPAGLKLPQLPPWAIAMAGPLMFGALDVAAVMTEGVGRVELHNPIGLFAYRIAGLLAEKGAVAPLAFVLYAAAKIAVVGLCAALAYGACTTAAPRRRHLLLAGQLACALAMDSLVFHLLVAAQLAMLLPIRTGLKWLVAQYLLGVVTDGALIATASSGMQHDLRWSMLAYLSLERTLIGAAFYLARLVLRERLSRVALAAAHAQVLATQTLLGETVRGAERMRIARDLHDTLGHHLTALNLHLDLALRQAGGAAPAALGTAHGLGKDLLAQVRGVVTHARQDRAIDLAEALRVLCAGLPALRTELNIDDQAARHPPHVAHTLFCCIQEAVTNTLRHAQATRLTIHLETSAGMTVARVVDNGRGVPEIVEGNGLRGMRERLTDMGGDLHVAAGAPGGLALEMRLPGSAA
ncbi:sensor histidine kinase [Pseudoduganella dura]|nr:histidine kinase [Pseudoduganella dura]